LMTILGILYGKPMNECLIDIYWHSLFTFNFQAIKDAFYAHVQDPNHGQFMPKPADVIRHLETAPRAKAIAAWKRVMQAVRTIGSYRSVVFDDPLIHCAITDMGGWVKLCEMTEKDAHLRAIDFEGRYLYYLKANPENYPKQLTGLAERQNSIKGYPSNPPALVGDVFLAHKVYSNGCIPLSHTNVKNLIDLSINR
jgi:Domain of unknown function (DUF6475)